MTVKIDLRPKPKLFHYAFFMQTWEADSYWVMECKTKLICRLYRSTRKTDAWLKSSVHYN